MSDFIDVQDIAIRNRIAVDGRVNPTIEDWNNLLTHIDRLEQENAELRSVLDRYKEREYRQDIAGFKLMIGVHEGLDEEMSFDASKALHKRSQSLGRLCEELKSCVKVILTRVDSLQRLKSWLTKH